jgi:hypothetical protein
MKVILKKYLRFSLYVVIQVRDRTVVEVQVVTSSTDALVDYVVVKLGAHYNDSGCSRQRAS